MQGAVSQQGQGPDQSLSEGNASENCFMIPLVNVDCSGLLVVHDPFLKVAFPAYLCRKLFLPFLTCIFTIRHATGPSSLALNSISSTRSCRSIHRLLRFVYADPLDCCSKWRRILFSRGWILFWERTVSSLASSQQNSRQPWRTFWGF